MQEGGALSGGGMGSGLGAGSQQRGADRGLQGGQGWASESPCGASGQAFLGDAPSGHHSGQEPNTPTLSNSTMTSWGGNQGPGKESCLPGARQLVQAKRNTHSRTLSTVLGRDAG